MQGPTVVVQRNVTVLCANKLSDVKGYNEIIRMITGS